jgi:hypothetical protein
VVTATALLIALQLIEPSPRQAEVGDTVVVEARDAAGRPLKGLDVTVREPGGDRSAIGTTDAAGHVTFVPEQTGRYRIESERDGVVLIAPFYAVPAPRRWLYAVPLTVLGALLLWRNLLGLQRDRARSGGPDSPGHGGA